MFNNNLQELNKELEQFYGGFVKFILFSGITYGLVGLFLLIFNDYSLAGSNVGILISFIFFFAEKSKRRLDIYLGLANLILGLVWYLVFFI